MATSAQTFANHQNAQASTGARTDEGKYSSSRNATKWGLTGQTVVIRDEDEAGYQALLAEHTAEYAPQTLAERELVTEVAASSWRLSRARRIETELFDAAFDNSANPKDGHRAGQAQSNGQERNFQLHGLQLRRIPRPARKGNWVRFAVRESRLRIALQKRLAAHKTVRMKYNLDREVTMSQPQTAPHLTPEHIFDVINAHQKSSALRAAIELDLFTAIGEGSVDLAERCHASPRGIRILCDYLTVIGFLTKGEGGYALTPESALFLDKRSPAYLGTTVQFLQSPMLMGAATDITAAVRKGGTVLENHGTMAPEHPVWVDFANAMVPMMMPTARALATFLDPGTHIPCKVLDIAAGHGMYGLSIAIQNPNAEIYSQDWPNVLAVAKENAAKFGVSDRHHLIPGSAFEVDFGSGYDYVLLPNFLHHFDPPTCEQLLRKVHAALKPGGKALTVEFVPNEDRVSPPVPAEFSLMMLISTESGDAYTFRELETMFANAGYTGTEAHRFPVSPQTVLVSSKG